MKLFLSKRKSNSQIGCIVLIIIFLIIIFSLFPSKNKDTMVNTVTEIKDKRGRIESDSTIDYSIMNYNLPDSEYIYKIRISKIETDIQKDVFETKEDNYSIPVKVDGYLLSLTVEITNPYDKQMMVPIPYYYKITSINDEYFTNSLIYDTTYNCKVETSSKIKDNKGKELWKNNIGKCDGYGVNSCVIFNPNETRSFIISFTEPIIFSSTELIFIDFTVIPDFKKGLRPKGIIIDTNKKKVTGIKYF